MYYFYEGRTIRGMGPLEWALIILVATAAVMGLTTALLGLAYPALVNNSTSLFGPFLGVLAVICLTFVADLAAGILFLVGFFQIYQGRHEYGLDQVRSMDRALSFLIIYVVLSAVSVVYTSAGGLLLGTGALTGLAAFAPALVLNPVIALFAGLTLEHSVRGVASSATRSRLRTALALGIVGAAVGPAMNLLATSGSGLTLTQVSTGIIAAALGGQGISAISLLLFWLAYVEVHRSLEAGSPAPVLPRIEQVYPWLYRPWIPYPYPPPGPPPQPPKT